MNVFALLYIAYINIIAATGKNAIEQLINYDEMEVYNTMAYIHGKSFKT